MSKFKIALRAFSLASVILFAATGCGGNDDDDTPPGQVSSGTVAGRVADAQTGEAIAGVEVKIGALKATSDANGKYSLAGVPLGADVVAQFTKATYAANFATVEVINGKISTADRRLAKVAVKQDISAATGGTVTLAGSPAQVQLPAAGIVNAAGAAVSGTVSVEMTPINPGAMPGNYRAQGEASPIETFGALQVELRDATGALLNLAPGKTATIRIPVPQGAASPPLAIPLYYFKESTGLWVREGSAQLAGSPPQQYYEGQVSHFSTWNADQVYDTIFINGCVVDGAGQPVTATVISEGIDYFGSATVSTSADGKFKVPARRSSQVQVGAHSGADHDSVIVATGLTDLTLPACLVVAQKPPVIVTQPASLTLAPGSMNSLIVTANNGEQYKWYRNGELIASGARFITIYGSSGAAGNYHVVVSNAHGSVTSATVTVTVAAPSVAPVVVSQPQNASVLAGTAPTFAVQALGDSLTYQWLRNGVDIASAQGPKLTLGPVGAADNGALFSVRVKNAAGTVVSGNALLTVTAEAVAPAISTQPGNASVAVGQSATFAVVAAGTAPFTYQWLRNGAAITGATAATYQTPATTLADSGARFTVRVTNSKGNVLSAEATLTVSPGSSVSGLHLAFPTGLSVNGRTGFGAIPAAGGTAVPFWPAGAGDVADYLVQGQLSNGVASNIHMRAMMFWKDQQLVRRDLVGSNGLPAEVRVSSITVADMCGANREGAEHVASGVDLVDANRSWHVYQKRGADTSCNTDDDRYFAVRANMGAAEAPLEVPRPLASLHSASGAMTGWLIRSGQQMQRVNADFTSPVTLFTLPGDDLESDGDADLDNDWIFTSGGKVYAVNLAAAAPAGLTLVATLADEEWVTDVTFANQHDVLVSIAGGTSTRILRFLATSKAVNLVGTFTGQTSTHMVTPTRVVVRGEQGSLWSAPLTGGTPQAVYAQATSPLVFEKPRGGERIWFETGAAVVSVNSDGSGVQTLPGARLTGCINKPLQSAEDAFGACEAVVVLEGNVVRSYDAATGAARITYGTITLPNAPLSHLVYFSFLTSWGQNGVLSQFIGDPANPLSQSVVSHLIKTDQAGMTPIVLP